MKPTVSLDCDELPIVVLTFHESPTLADLDRALLRFDELLRERIRYVLVMDVIAMGVVPSALRQRAARWLIENGVDVTAYCRGVVCVATTPLARASVIAMEWLDPRGAKYVMVDTLEAAMQQAHRIAAG